MANAEHLEILRSGIEIWNRKRGLAYLKNEASLFIVDLSGASLGGANLGKADLIEADMKQADLSNCNLVSAQLPGANLFCANLSKANLSYANLTKADLYKAELSHAQMSWAKFGDANLSYANLSSANLTQSILYDANLTNANLTGVNLTGAILTGVNLTEANLTGVNLTGANLTGANLTGADLTKADLSDADLTDANLTDANLFETIFTGTKLDHTIFGLTNLSSCKNLKSVNVFGECVIDFPTLTVSKNLPKEFLTKLGIPDLLMECLPDFYSSALTIYPAFLSHSWADKEFVRKLYETLTKKGVTTWLDEKKLKPGDNIHDSITEGIKHYDKLILVCSNNSLNSWWVEKELEKVYEKEREMQKERGKKFRLVIPIRIDDHIFQCKEGILTTVRNSMIGDFTKWQDEVAFEEAVKELVGALNANRVDIRPPSLL